MAGALLLMGCSSRKVAGDRGRRAWDVYDGRLFQVLKKLFRQRGRPPGLDILIVSARYGVIREARRIVAYDDRLGVSPVRGNVVWAAQLRRLIRDRDYCRVHVNLGAVYRAALPDLRDEFRTADVSFAEGGIGKRNAASRAWVLALPRP